MDIDQTSAAATMRGLQLASPMFSPENRDYGTSPSIPQPIDHEVPKPANQGTRSPGKVRPPSPWPSRVLT